MDHKSCITFGRARRHVRNPVIMEELMCERSKSTKEKKGNQPSTHLLYPSTLLSTQLKEKLCGKNRRFQLRSLHTRHAFICTPKTKDAENCGLQNCQGDMVCSSMIVAVSFYECLYNAFYLCSS
jgi:hypothetical protein